jgi:hypothetical protein
MEDLSAATAEDARAFFTKWYGPANTSVVIAGDVDAGTAFDLAAKWFGEIPPGPRAEPPVARPVRLETEKRLVLEDDVELPRLYLSWPIPERLAPALPALESAAAILATARLASSGGSSTTSRPLDVALPSPGTLAFDVTVTRGPARPGRDRPARGREVPAWPPSSTEREVAPTIGRLPPRRDGSGMFGKADVLNAYLVSTGD